MKAEEVANVLAEFNTWRRGLPPYEWNEDPSKQKELQYSAKEIGVAIDEAVDMLRQAAGLMEQEEKRERKYEYSWMIETGEASIYNRTPSLDVVKMVAPEDAKIVRREVGEWEEVKDV